MTNTRKVVASSYYILNAEVDRFPYEVALEQGMTMTQVDEINRLLCKTNNQTRTAWGWRFAEVSGFIILCTDPVESALIALHLNELNRLGVK